MTDNSLHQISDQISWSSKDDFTTNAIWDGVLIADARQTDYPVS